MRMKVVLCEREHSDKRGKTHNLENTLHNQSFSIFHFPSSLFFINY